MYIRQDEKGWVEYYEFVGWSRDKGFEIIVGDNESTPEEVREALNSAVTEAEDFRKKEYEKYILPIYAEFNFDALEAIAVASMPFASKYFRKNPAHMYVHSQFTKGIYVFKKAN